VCDGAVEVPARSESSAAAPEASRVSGPRQRALRPGVRRRGVGGRRGSWWGDRRLRAVRFVQIEYRATVVSEENFALAFGNEDAVRQEKIRSQQHIRIG